MKTDFWRDRPVLVTGCTGLLGSWLTRELVGRGASVVGLIRDGVPRSSFFQYGLDRRIISVFGDVQDRELLERVLNEYDIDAVFHLAAQTIVGIANRDPLPTFEINIRGTWNLLEACRRCAWVKRIVVASTDKAYGTQPALPYTEAAPLQGKHPYDVSKSCADLIAQAYWHTYHLPVCITRCGNLFGGGDLNFNRIVPGTIRSALRRQPPVIRSDGRMRRDYFYVLDAVQGYLQLAEQMEALACYGEAFNFSLETPLTVLEITRRILSLMHLSDLEPEIRNEARHEIPDQYLSAEKARLRLGWKPGFSLDQALAATVEWYREYCASSVGDSAGFSAGTRPALAVVPNL